MKYTGEVMGRPMIDATKATEGTDYFRVEVKDALVNVYRIGRVISDSYPVLLLKHTIQQDEGGYRTLNYKTCKLILN